MRWAVVTDRGVELIRTDRRVAEQDASLIREIGRRSAWVEEYV